MAATTRNYRAVTRQPRLGPQPALTESHSAFLAGLGPGTRLWSPPPQPWDPIRTPIATPAEAILLQGSESCPLPVPGSGSHPSPPLHTGNTREGRAFWVPSHSITPSFPSLSLSSLSPHQTKQSS